MYQQYVLVSGDRQTTGWLADGTPRVHVGTRLTLKHEPATVWTIVAIHGPALSTPPVQRWAVGGIEY